MIAQSTDVERKMINKNRAQLTSELVHVLLHVKLKFAATLKYITTQNRKQFQYAARV